MVNINFGKNVNVLYVLILTLFNDVNSSKYIKFM